MKLVTTLFFLLISFLGLTQTVINGIVIDENNKKPLSYVSFFSKNNNTGFISDENDKYAISYTKDDSITISCVGYNDTVVLLSKLQTKPTIYLSNQVYDIEEVVVLPHRKNKIKTIGYFSKSIGKCVSASNLYVKIDNPYIDEFATIEAIKFNILKPFGKPLPFRMRIRANDENGKTCDLIHDNLIFDNYTLDKTQLVEFDISKYCLKMPRDGIIITFETLNINESFSINSSPFFGTVGRSNTLEVGVVVKVIK